MQIVPFRGLLTAQIGLAVLVFAGSTTASAEQSPTVPAIELIRRTVHNEISSANDEARYLFRDRKDSGHGSQTKLIVETRDAVVGLLIAIDDKPLTAEQKQEEDARVERFVKDPDELKKRQRQEREDADRVQRIMKALPDAFLYDYDETVPGCDGMGKAGRTLTRLTFRPNPAYVPPSRVEQVLTTMGGYMLVDTNANRIAKIDGTLQDEVSFGWGILGHLDRGGHFLVQQADAGDGHWEISRMDLAFTGKILLFKSINYTQTEVMTDFKSVPSNLTFAQGLELLRKHEALLAENEAALSPATTAK